MGIRVCSEVGCNEPVERGHSRCPACREYITEIKQHDRAEPETDELTQVGMSRWLSKAGFIYEGTGEGEDSFLDANGSDQCMDGRD
jgi:hypothetical protein